MWNLRENSTVNLKGFPLQFTSLTVIRVSTCFLNLPLKVKNIPRKTLQFKAFHVTFWLTPSIGNITIVLLNLEFFKASLLYLYGKQTRVTKRWEFWNLEKKGMNYVSSHNQRNDNFQEVWKTSEKTCEKKQVRKLWYLLLYNFWPQWKLTKSFFSRIER